jgi:hypothetical protein
VQLMAYLTGGKQHWSLGNHCHLQHAGGRLRVVISFDGNFMHLRHHFRLLSCDDLMARCFAGQQLHLR